jgi:diguanylate cyclase (GGDEF)-like protein/PAS domain S-box-containing protein
VTPDEPTRAESDRPQAENGMAQTRSILDSANEAFIAMDAGGFITDWNPEAERTFGWSREEAVGRVLADTIIPERYRGAHLRGLQRFLETGEGPVLGKRLELEGVHRDGREFPVELTISPERIDGRHAFNAFLHDITARKRAEQFLHAQHAVTRVLSEAEDVGAAMPKLLQALCESMAWDVGAYWTPESEERLRCRSIWHAPEVKVPGFRRMSEEITFAQGVGLPGRVWESGKPALIEDVTQDPNFPRAGAADEAGLHAAVGLPVEDRGQFRGVIEFFTRRTRQLDWELLDMMDTLSRQIARFLAILGEREDARSKLERLALTDELTGLANRRAWNDGLERELARARREGTPICVALIDIDRFKDFNDEHGHQAGDEVLEEAARAWQSRLRATDLLARYGGEEFSLVFPAWPMDKALGVVERLRGVLPGGLTCSAGLASWRGQESAEELMGRVDAALYEAKRAGRDRTAEAE